MLFFKLNLDGTDIYMIWRGRYLYLKHSIYGP